MQGVVDFLLLAILRSGERCVEPSVQAVSVQVVLPWIHKEGCPQSKCFLCCLQYLVNRPPFARILQ